jgi:hypothetical protein
MKNMKYFIMAWDDDSETKRYYEFYFLADKDENLLLFESEKEAECFGRKTCKYFNICSWHNYMVGNCSVNIKRLVLKNVKTESATC